MRRGAVLVAGLALALLGGCAQLKMGVPVPSIDNIQKARSAGVSPVAVGSFQLAPGKPGAMDQRVTARGNTVFSPYESSFARYLKEALAADLGAAGLLDPNSHVVIDGWLPDSRLDVPAGQATATVAARFTVTHDGVKRYDKELRASATWQAPFVGIEAVPAAINEYGLLYRKLVAMLLDDPAFRAATHN
jgi:hypothetical protein